MDDSEQAAETSKPERHNDDPAGPNANLVRTGGWVAAAGMGIGSAALVAALLYSGRGKNGKKPE